MVRFFSVCTLSTRSCSGTGKVPLSQTQSVLWEASLDRLHTRMELQFNPNSENPSLHRSACRTPESTHGCTGTGARPPGSRLSGRLSWFGEHREVKWQLSTSPCPGRSREYSLTLRAKQPRDLISLFLSHIRAAALLWD